MRFLTPYSKIEDFGFAFEAWSSRSEGCRQAHACERYYSEPEIFGWLSCTRWSFNRPRVFEPVFPICPYIGFNTTEPNEALEPMRMSASIIREELMEILNTVLRMAQLER